MNRVVITGMGIVSSIGIGKEEVTKSLREGKCGIKLDESRSGFRSTLTGFIPELPSPNRNCAPQTVYMYHAIKEALSEYSVHKVKVRKEDDHYVMDLFDIHSGELQVSQEQCPKIFQDYDIVPEIYINYSPEWL